MFRKFSFLVYSIFCYVLFLASFIYLAGFLINWGVTKSIDSSIDTVWWLAILIDLGLITLFGLQHTLMARNSFKKLWIRLIPNTIERSTYVLMSTCLIILIFVFWQPIPFLVWEFNAVAPSGVLWLIFIFGWVLLLYSTFVIDHFELFGLRQTWCELTGKRIQAHQFQTPGPYRLVRHPMMTGLIMIFWATPQMSIGHLTFAAGMTLYILIGTMHEERDLIRSFKTKYQDYQRLVPRLAPRITPLSPKSFNDS